MATATERDALTSRILPQMTLSKGDETSLTGPPAPASRFLKAQERAAKRFEVHGNAMYEHRVSKSNIC
jgi:sorbose reductase